MKEWKHRGAVLVGRHPAFRAGLKEILARGSIRTLAEFDTLEAAAVVVSHSSAMTVVEVEGDLEPNVIMGVDRPLPGLCLYASRLSRQAVATGLSFGALGFFSKTDTVEVIQQVLAGILNGMRVYSPSVEAPAVVLDPLLNSCGADELAVLRALVQKARNQRGWSAEMRAALAALRKKQATLG